MNIKNADVDWEQGNHRKISRTVQEDTCIVQLCSITNLPHTNWICGVKGLIITTWHYTTCTETKLKHEAINFHLHLLGVTKWLLKQYDTTSHIKIIWKESRIIIVHCITKLPHQFVSTTYLVHDPYTQTALSVVSGNFIICKKAITMPV